MHSIFVRIKITIKIKYGLNLKRVSFIGTKSKVNRTKKVRCDIHVCFTVCSINNN